MGRFKMISKWFILVLCVTLLLYLILLIFKSNQRPIISQPDYLVKETSQLHKMNVTSPNEFMHFEDLPKSLQEDGIVPYRNVLEETLPPFLTNYKNPCWREKKNPEIDLNCLPYAYLIGMSKCGTTDLSAALFRHPYLLYHGEIHWWSKKRIFRKGGFLQGESLRQYTHKFKKDIQQLDAISIPDGVHPDGYHPALLVDRSPSTMFWNGQWDKTPENSGQSIEEGPLYHNAHYIHHVTPQAKLIVTLRNPTDRLYSWYLRDPNLTGEYFHKMANESIRYMTNCIEQKSLWNCVNNKTIPGKGKIVGKFRSCMYYPFVKAWLDVFPRQQIFFSRMEDYSKNRTKRINEIFNFLDLEPLSTEILSHVGIRGNKTRFYKEKGHMLPKTRKMLDAFFYPFNKQLATLLQDKIWLFHDT